MSKYDIYVVHLKTGETFFGTFDDTVYTQTKRSDAKRIERSNTRNVLLPGQPSCIRSWSYTPKDLGRDGDVATTESEFFDCAAPDTRVISLGFKGERRRTHISISDWPFEYSSAVSKKFIPWSKAVLMISCPHRPSADTYMEKLGIMHLDSIAINTST